jgi:hypothetical protein
MLSQYDRTQVDSVCFEMEDEESIEKYRMSQYNRTQLRTVCSGTDDE